ncbi:hypothetical protein SteCoe_7713 [Stentor coeruleus]|uniref:Uncharacterized protein n=1 Tax=Stentor coeruleus TaxID=5963 RepID=A0A1R2CM14_9CILI|nr:hypothetical protein SteCoe_7713 [Stentor coeruleus]
MNSSPSRIRTTPQHKRAKQPQSYLTPNKTPNPKSTTSTYELIKSCHEKSCCGHVTRSHYNSFLIEIQKEMKRLDSSFEFNFDDKTVFARIFSIIKQSVDYILLIQSKYSNTDWVDLENFQSNLKFQEAKLKNEAEKLRLTSKNLEQYDSLLKSKEDQLKCEEKELKSKLEFIRQEDIYNEELKLKFIQQEHEIRLLKKQKLAETSIIENTLGLEIKQLKKQNSNLKQALSQKSLSQNLKEPILSEPIIHKEKSKLPIKLENLIIKTKTNKSSTQNIEIEKLSLSNTDNIETSNRSNMDYDSKIKDLILKEALSHKNETHLENYLSKIRETIEEYNQELEKRENNLCKLQKDNEAKEKSLNQQIEEIRLIENSIINSKKEIEEFNAIIMPAFEEYSEALSQLLADLYVKKQEFIEYTDKAYQLIEDIEVNKLALYDKTDNKQYQGEDIDKKIIEKHEQLLLLEKSLMEKQESLNMNTNDMIYNMTIELQQQLERCKIKEQQVNEIKEALEAEKMSNEKIALMLKVAHLEFENNKNKENEKIRYKKDKLKALKGKLESHLKAVQAKDQDGSLKSTLDDSKAIRSYSLDVINEKTS